jgi:single-stranded-DNA-specific exonuclease
MKSSLRGYRWGGLDANPVMGGLFDQFLAKRGENRLALELTLDDALMIAGCQSGFSECVDMICDAIGSKEHIFVFGDYDVDGMTSAAIWLRVIRALGGSAEALIPERKAGYGLSQQAVDAANASGARVLLCVDSGTDRVREIAEASAYGLKTIVVDHHLPKGGRGEASCPNVLINGHFSADPMLAKLCAAGQSFALASAVFDRLCDPVEEGDRAAVRRHLLQFAAVGTVSDMMDIGPGFNRAVVVAGLEELRACPVPSLNSLIAALFPGGEEKISVATISFGIGPAINAAGRFSQPRVAMSLLLADEPGLTDDVARELVKLNDERKSLQSKMFDEAMENLDRGRAIAAYVGDDWEKGLVGLVASGMLDALQRPALAATRLGDTIHGSGRSTPGFDLGRAVIAAHQKGLLIGGGGHAAACGFQCAVDQWSTFVSFVEQEFLRADEAPTHHVDFMIEPRSLVVEEIDEFRHLAPYGQGWPAPIIGVQCTLRDVSVIGKNKDTIRVHAGFKGIAFRANHNGLLKLTEARGRRAIVIGEPVVSEFGGALSAEMRIRDVVVI